MTFDSVTYTAPILDFTLESEDAGSSETTCAKQGLAAFLLRLMAYFQGCLSSLPCAPRTSITVIDSSLEDSSEPLMQVRMSRHLSRRLRWLIRRGRVERLGKLRLTTAEDEARCNLTPGQFNEYCIRVHRRSRVRLYGLGLGRRALRLRGFTMALLQGGEACFCRASQCSAPLTPD